MSAAFAVFDKVLQSARLLFWREKGIIIGMNGCGGEKMKRKNACALWRILALILALCLCPAAYAEKAEEDIPKMVVEALFEAAAGTTADREEQARKTLQKAEIEARNAQNAAWRAETKLWLLEALRPLENDPESTPAPTPSPAPETSEETVPVLDPEAVYMLFQTNESGQKYVELMRSLGYEGAENCLKGTREYYAQWRSTIDVIKLTTINEDYVAWIYQPSTAIDYPVVQCSDNDYYLNHLFNGGRNSCGTIFVDYRNLPEFQESNTLIYGHHMRNGSMFKAITYYARQAYYDAHPYLLLIAPEAHYLIEVVAAYTTDSKDHCYQMALSDYEAMREYIYQAKRKSNCDTFVEVLPGDRLVTLSTCAYAFENARYIAIGKLNQTWERPKDWQQTPVLQMEDQDLEEVSIALP